MNMAKKLFLQILLHSALKICEPSVFEKSAYHKHSQQNENCICYTNDLINEKLPLVSEILEPTNFGFERLVVYFYKDLYSQKLAMYIPNTTKQYLIPDLSFESKDILVYPASTETIHNMVNINLKKIIINGIYEAPESTVGSVDPVPSNSHESLVNTPDIWNLGIVEIDGLSDDKPPQDEVTSSELVNIIINEIEKDESNIANLLVEPVTNNPDSPFKQISSENLDIIWDEHNLPPFKIKKNKDNIDMNKWFEQQILNIDDNPNTFDVESLRIHILKTLLKNKITVTPDGTLIDAWGSSLDPSNLIVSPILLDSSIGYDHLLENFIQAIIVSLKNPPKVLGIIPLGKTHLPHSVRYSLVHDKNVIPTHTSTTSKANCLNGLCFSEASVNSDPLDSAKLDYRIIPSTRDVNKKLPTLKRGVNNVVYRAPVLKTDQNYDYPAINDILTVNLKDDGELKTTLDKIAKFILSRKQHNDIEVKAEEIETNSNIDEEGPGIRIIGGSAATGSGTPVSSRGRSGTSQNNIRFM